jgi:hypothetical protein
LKRGQGNRFNDPDAWLAGLTDSEAKRDEVATAEFSDEENKQIDAAATEIREALGKDHSVKGRAAKQAETYRQSFLGMQAYGSFDVLAALRDKNSYESIRRAIPELGLPLWREAIAQVTPLTDDTMLAAQVAGYEPPRKHGKTQLWEPCSNCKQEPSYLETGLCQACEDRLS